MDTATFPYGRVSDTFHHLLLWRSKKPERLPKFSIWDNGTHRHQHFIEPLLKADIPSGSVGSVGTLDTLTATVAGLGI
jgi:hypothetical protein